MVLEKRLVRSLKICRNIGWFLCVWFVCCWLDDEIFGRIGFEQDFVCRTYSSIGELFAHIFSTMTVDVVVIAVFCFSSSRARVFFFECSFVFVGVVMELVGLRGV